MIRLATGCRLIASLAALFCAVAAQAGQNYYVDKDHPTAADGNPGTQGQPWRTLQKAGQTAEAGDIVWIRESAEPYFEPIDDLGSPHDAMIRIENSGSPGLPISFVAYPGDKPVIDQQFQGPGFWIESADHITITGLEIRNVNVAGIAVQGPAQNIVIRYNDIHDVTSRIGLSDNIGALRLNDCTNCIVEYNDLHDVYVPEGFPGHADNVTGLFTLGMQNMQILGNRFANANVGVLNKRSSGQIGGVIMHNSFSQLTYGVLLSAQHTGAPAHVLNYIELNQFSDCTVGVRAVVHETLTPSRGVIVRSNVFVRSSGLQIRGSENVQFSYNRFVNLSAAPAYEGMFGPDAPRFVYIDMYDPLRPTRISNWNFNIYDEPLLVKTGVWGPDEKTFSSRLDWRRGTGHDWSGFQFEATPPGS